MSGVRTGNVFRALRASRTFRIWWAASVVSNVGAWMQRIGQDWLVLTILTRHDARAVGVVVALQFAPQVLLLPWTGWAADHLDRRRLLLVTQAAMGLLALGLGLDTVSGAVRAWHVDAFAFLLGCAAAFDAPARQTFLSELVPAEHLSNAIALNSTAFNASRLVGPALAGLLIAAAGTGPIFLINAASFLGVLLVLVALKPTHTAQAREQAPGGLLEGLRYVWARPDLTTLMAMLFVFGALGLNFPIFISTMAVSAFHLNSGGFGLLTSAMAVGTVSGTLLAARRERPSVRVIATGALAFGCFYALAALTPDVWLFAATLALVGVASQTVTTSTITLIQLTADKNMRGRVVALALTVALGGQPVGAPFVGWVAHAFGPRWALAVGSAAGLFTALIGGLYSARESRVARGANVGTWKQT